MFRTRYLATYYLPGFFFPEEIAGVEVDSPDLEDVLAGRPEPDWYAASISRIKEEGLFSAYTNDVDWIVREREKVASFVIGTSYHYTELEAGTILRDNAKYNGGYVVKTRLGNWQPKSAYDFVVAPEDAG